MKHELLYQTQEDFTTAQGNSGNVTSITPGVAYINETGTVARFNKPYSPLVAVYNVTGTSEGTKIYGSNNAKTDLAKVTIDKQDVPVSSLTDTYQFNLIGKHKIIFYYKTLTAVQANAFNGCKDLAYVKFPNETTSIGQAAFKGCTNLQTVVLNNVTDVGISGFTEDTSLHNIEFEKLVSIGTCAFEYCTNLPKHITFKKLKTIKLLAFQYTNVESAEFKVLERWPDGDRNSGIFGFCNNMKSLVFSDSLVYLGRHPFSRNRRSDFTATFYSTTPPGTNSGYPDEWFYGTAGRAFYVPAESLEAYRTAPVWSNYAAIIQPMP